MRILRLITPVVLLLSMGACGTTFALPEIDADSEAAATKLFAASADRPARVQASVSAAERRFSRVARRIEPVGRTYCEALMADRPDFNCDAQIEIDRDMESRNAYFTYEDDTPVIRLSLPLLRDTRSDDEAAFVMAHEYGHLIGRHIQKQTQQQIAGALILGTIAAAASAQNAAYGGTYDTNLVNSSVDIGMALGSVAYSQAYELESDTLGAYISHDAGFDPIKGAEYFARPDEATQEGGALSFWGTHPPDAKRVAVVIAAKKRIDAGQGLVVGQ